MTVGIWPKDGWLFETDDNFAIVRALGTNLESEFRNLVILVGLVPAFVAHSLALMPVCCMT